MDARTPQDAEPAGSDTEPAAPERAAPRRPLNLQQVLDFPAPGEAQLRALFGLTVSEARLARHLASGDTVEEVAERLGIKLSTARTQLAGVFAKTGVNRQTKLVALLSRVAHLG